MSKLDLDDMNRLKFLKNITPSRSYLPTFFIFAGIAPKDKTSESKF